MDEIKLERPRHLLDDMLDYIEAVEELVGIITIGDEPYIKDEVIKAIQSHKKGSVLDE